MIELLLSMDDTDNLTSPGTGKILDHLRLLIEEKGLGKTDRITRHQLFVHPDVPYTSHNSAMCFSMTSNVGEQQIRALAVEHLEAAAAGGSDPGLALASTTTIRGGDELKKFGLAAKLSILTKTEAYDLAAACGVSLSEHGGTGDGVIGALAAIGLRLEGNDGRYRGGLPGFRPGEDISVVELQRSPGIDEIFVAAPGTFAGDDLKGVRLGSEAGVMHGRLEPVDPEMRIVLDEKVKTIRMNCRSVLLVTRDRERMRYRNWTKEELKVF